MTNNPDLAFPISLSVGTACQAKCPYCTIPRLPQRLADGRQLIAAADRLMGDVGASFRRFSVRVTGGEIGLVADLDAFIAWLNGQERVTKVRLYTNGALFENRAADLAQKCYVQDHTVHDVLSGRLVRYAHDGAPGSLEEIRDLIARRRPRCRGYRMVMVERPGLDAEDRLRLEAAGVRFVELTGAAGGGVEPSSRADTAFCFVSRYLYVYDVAHDVYFHCCEVKDPAKGTHALSLAEFLRGSSGSPYPECRGCRTCRDIRTHRNAAALDRLRDIAPEEGAP
jgi:hypothetical protein